MSFPKTIVTRIRAGNISSEQGRGVFARTALSVSRRTATVLGIQKSTTSNLARSSIDQFSKARITSDKTRAAGEITKFETVKSSAARTGLQLQGVRTKSADISLKTIEIRHFGPIDDDIRIDINGDRVRDLRRNILDYSTVAAPHPPMQIHGDWPLPATVDYYVTDVNPPRNGYTGLWEASSSPFRVTFIFSDRSTETRNLGERLIVNSPMEFENPNIGYYHLHRIKIAP